MVGKSLLEIFFSKPIRRLKPTERPAEEATTDQCLAVVTLFSDYALGQLVLEKWKKKINNTVNFEELNQLQNCYFVIVFGDIITHLDFIQLLEIYSEIIFAGNFLTSCGKFLSSYILECHIIYLLFTKAFCNSRLSTTIVYIMCGTIYVL